MSEQLLLEASRRGFENLYTRKTLSCSQAVLIAIQQLFGPEDALLVKAAGPMAGGSRVGSLCGALQGGVLSLGMHFGTSGEQMSNLNALLDSYQPVQQLYSAFEKAFGSRFCPEIIRADLDRIEERQRWLDSGGWEHCARLCGQTSRMVAEIILYYRMYRDGA